MSHLKKIMDSTNLKEKYSTLLESLDRTNTSKMIIERHYARVASLEISEGNATANDVYAELKGLGVEQNKARHMVQVASLTEAKTQFADQFLLKRIDILESSMKELKAYSWMKSIGDFIKEGEEFLQRNEVYILIEQIIYDLEMDNNRSYFAKSINKLREVSESENPVIDILERMEEDKWIPLVKRLYEYASKLKGSITGENPNFKISRVYSPVESIDENRFVFVSSGKILETNGSIIEESDFQLTDNFKSLLYIAESARFFEKGMRIYPNTNSVLDLEFGDTTTVKLNGKVVESTEVANHLLSAGYVKMGETGKLSYITQAVSEGSKIKDINFAYKVVSSIFEGLSATVFNLNEKVYIQKVNRGMKENVLIEAQSAEEAIRMVKDFMNYDISNSLIHLLENEKAEASRREKEINKIESRIKFLIESLADLERVAKINGVEGSEHIKKAKELLLTQITEQNKSLEKFGLIQESNPNKTLNKKLNESHFKIGDKVTCKASGKTGKVVKLDKEHGKDDEKYYTVKIDGSREIKYAPNELTLNESHCTPGKEYNINDKLYVYQGETDGVHIFNTKEGNEPINMTDSEYMEACESGIIK